MMIRSTFHCPLGPLLIVADLVGIRGIYFPDHAKPTRNASVQAGSNSIIELAQKQLEEYFAGHRETFDVPLNPEGTVFQKKVWGMLQTIPFGDTWSYQKLAQSLDHPKAMRAVGAANSRNPISILIPCHRVIGANGSLTGYAGGLERKKWLLEHELRSSNS